MSNTYTPNPASAATDSAYTYGGKEHNEDTGLSYFEARHYAPAIGKFISMDPFPRRATKIMVYNPQSWNSYGYALNNPVIYSDPTGESAAVAAATAGTIAMADSPVPGPGDVIALSYIVIKIGMGISDFFTHDNAIESPIVSTTPTPAYEGDENSIMSMPGEQESGINTTANPGGALGGEKEDGFMTTGGISYGAISDWVQAGDPTIAPADGFIWNVGAWYNPETKESVYPHFNGDGHDPHADYTDRNSGEKTRIYGDGTKESKS